MPLPALPRSALALALCLASLALPAHAQWAWRDANGTTVFSDQPPPSSVKPNQIVRQPRAAASPIILEDAPATPAKSAEPPKAAKTLAEREQEFQKRQKERAETETKAADEEKKRLARAAECERARGYLKALESGHRVAQTDASGQRAFLDDAQRSAEIERVRQSLQSACN